MSRSLPAMVGVYRPGTTWLHRLPVGVKVSALGAFSLSVVAIRSLPAALVFLTIALLASVVGRVDLRTLARSARAILTLAVFAAALQWWWYGGAKAAETLLDLITLALAAVTLSATTSVNEMLDAVVRWLGPFRRVGVCPERVALAFALAIGALPGTVTIAWETRDAAKARGLDHSPRAHLTPFVIRVVAGALETGDALHARGLSDR